MPGSAKPKTIDEYSASAEVDKRAALESLRQVIKRAEGLYQSIADGGIT